MIDRTNMLELVRATERDEAVLRRLMELYLYDFSDIVDTDVDDTGRFGSSEYVESMYAPPYENYIARVDGKIAGFVVIGDRSYLTGDRSVRDVAQFFVMRRYRRKGLGKAMAANVFDMYPGRWEIRVMNENTAAQAFWRRTICGYAPGEFEERHVETDRQFGPVFLFDNSKT